MVSKQSKPTIILFYVIVATTLWKCVSIPISDFGDGWTLSFLLGTFKQVGAFTLFGVIPVGIVKFVFRENLVDYGWSFGDRILTLRSFLMMAPVIVIIAVSTGFNSAFFDVYPFNPAIRQQNAHVSLPIFAVNAVLYVGYYFGWEFLFRGFLQHGLSSPNAPGTALPTDESGAQFPARYAIRDAILIQTLASTMLHFGHPPSEVVGSIIAGIFWGLLAVRTKSILSGFLQHTLLGIVLDATLIYGTRG